MMTKRSALRAATTALGALACAVGAPQLAAQGAGAIVLRGVTLIDGTGAPGLAGMTIVMQDGRIRAVGGDQGDDVVVPAGATVHDLAGKFVIPGLIDAHMHLAPLVAVSREHLRAELARMLYGGIVATRVMAGPPQLHAGIARAARLDSFPSPDMEYAAVLAGPHFMAADPRIRGRTDVIAGVTGVADIPVLVGQAARAGASAVKLYAELDAPLMRAAVAEAHRLGLKAWAHAAVFPDRPMETVLAGVDGVSHACGLAWQDADLDPSRFPHVTADQRATFDPRLVDADSREMQLLFREMVRRKVVFDPTLFAQSRPHNARYGCEASMLAALTRAAHRAGVFIAAGTDFLADSADPFPALHQELELLVSTGILTPVEAITAATLNGARALGREHTAGTVQAGKVANLLVLDADPAADIRNLRSVTWIVQRGKIHRRADYPRATRTAPGPARVPSPLTFRSSTP